MERSEEALIRRFYDDAWNRWDDAVVDGRISRRVAATPDLNHVAGSGRSRGSNHDRSTWGEPSHVPRSYDEVWRRRDDTPDEAVLAPERRTGFPGLLLNGRGGVDIGEPDGGWWGVSPRRPGDI
jgi:hypothetical protein